MTSLGNALDVPFEENPPGQTLDLSDALLPGGIVVMASVIPVPEVGPKPALVFRFTAPDGRFYAPIVAVLDDDQLGKLTPLIAKAVTAARRAVRLAG